MHSLEVYYHYQAGRDYTHSGESALFMQRHSTYSVARHRRFYGILFRWVRPLLWRRADAVGRETAYQRHNPNRHCREQVTRSEPQLYRV